MLGKRFNHAAPVIVKANVPVNFMLDWAMRRHPDPRAIMLYLPFEDYLLAVLRTDIHRRWVESVGSELYPALASILDPADLLDPARIAAALWLAQMQRFAAALNAFPATRSLDARTFFAFPADTLAAAFALFGVAVPPEEVTAIVSGPLFSSYAKRDDLTFTEADWRDRRERDATRLSSEIVEARTWLDGRLEQHPLPKDVAEAVVRRRLLPSLTPATLLRAVEGGEHAAQRADLLRRPSGFGQ